MLGHRRQTLPMLERSRAAHAALRSLRASFRLVEILGAAEQETARGTLWIARPGRACLEFDPPKATPPAPGSPPPMPLAAPEMPLPGRSNGDPSGKPAISAAMKGKPTLASDGTRFVFSAPPAGWAWSIPVRANESAVRTVLDAPRMFDIGLVDLLVGADPWGGDHGNHRDAGPVTVDGVACRELVLTCGGRVGAPAEIRLSFGVADGLLRRMRSERTDGSGGISEAVFSRVQVNDPPSPARFRVDTKGLRSTEPGVSWSANLAPGVAAPLLIADDRTGREIDLEAWKGSVVLVHFWATFEPRSLWRVPEIVAVRRKFAGVKDFRILGVCLDSRDADRRVAKVISDWRMDWPQIHEGLGWESGAAKSWKIEGLPASALVGRDGQIFEMDPATSLAQSVALALAARKPKRG
jgi:hypothetical protein